MIAKQLILTKKAQQVEQLEESFKLSTTTLIIPLNQVLMVTKYISIDPIMRVWITGARTYLPSLQINDPIHAFAISSPAGSHNEFYFGSSGIRSHFIYDRQSADNRLLKIPKYMISTLQKANIPIQHLLPLILNGLPAYYGLVDFGKVKQGSNVLISTGAGATGLFCIQISLLKQCNVYALTSNIEKIQYLQSEYPQLKVLNYKDSNWVSQLPEDGIEVYFDNVGEEILDQVLPKMKNNGRIALCGSMGSSKDFQKRKGLQNINSVIFKRIKMKGITFNQELNKLRNAIDTLVNQVANGQIKIYLTEYYGLEQVPMALAMLFKGQNIGKILVSLDRPINAKL